MQRLAVPPPYQNVGPIVAPGAPPFLITNARTLVYEAYRNHGAFALLGLVVGMSGLHVKRCENDLERGSSSAQTLPHAIARAAVTFKSPLSTMVKAMFQGVICNFTEIDTDDILMGCKGQQECLCTHQQFCLAPKEEKYAVGMLKEGICGIGLPCCKYVLKKPEVLTLGNIAAQPPPIFAGSSFAGCPSRRPLAVECSGFARV